MNLWRVEAAVAAAGSGEAVSVSIVLGLDLPVLISDVNLKRGRRIGETAKRRLLGGVDFGNQKERLIDGKPFF